MTKKKTKLAALPIKPKPAKIKPLNYSEKLKKSFDKQHGRSTQFAYNYHSTAFLYFQSIIGPLTLNKKYRKEFWLQKKNGLYPYDIAQEYFQQYKVFIEAKMKAIVESYSIGYWLHFSRRIAPAALGEDTRSETIMICRNIINAAIQKYGRFESCGHLSISIEIEPQAIFKGFFTRPEFSNELEIIKILPRQLVLTDFDESNLLEYYELERLAYEMWYIGSKARVISKGADLKIVHHHEQILLDNRTPELERLMENFDNRTNSMDSTATGTVFSKNETTEPGIVLFTQPVTDRSGKQFSDAITELLEIEYAADHFPNYNFVIFKLGQYLQAHLVYAQDYQKKWGAKLEFIIAVIADLCIALLSDIILDKKVVVASNMYHRSYRIFDLNEMKEAIKGSWTTIITYLDLKLEYDANEINKAIDILQLSETNRAGIYIDSFGPLKFIIPNQEPGKVFIDFSLIGEILFNLFQGLPLQDFGNKGPLLEEAIKEEESYLPTTPSKALDGSTKQVDYSVARGEILVLVECKAVARSFGIFGGNPNAQKHRVKNVIDKGLDDVDKKVDWFLKHPKGTNYDITKFKYIVGIAVSAFLEFIPSEKEKYWLNKEIPRVLTIQEFKKLIGSDVQKTIQKNLKALSKP